MYLGSRDALLRPRPVQASNSGKERYMRLSSSAPVLRVPAGVSWIELPSKKIVNPPFWELSRRSARTPRRACPLELGQPDTDNQGFSLRARSKSVPTATTA